MAETKIPEELLKELFSRLKTKTRVNEISGISNPFKEGPWAIQEGDKDEAHRVARRQLRCEEWSGPEDNLVGEGVRVALWTGATKLQGTSYSFLTQSNVENALKVFNTSTTPPRIYRNLQLFIQAVPFRN